MPVTKTGQDAQISRLRYKVYNQMNLLNLWINQKGVKLWIP